MKLHYLLFLSFVSIILHAQNDFPSVHQREWGYYRQHPEMIGTEVAVPAGEMRSALRKNESLNGIVYGFHPYWMNGAEANYDFSLLTHLAYFSGDVDPTTGNFSSTNSWSSASVVTKAKQKGVKVHFTITQFSNHTALFNSYPNKVNLIKNIIAQIDLRGADGCNVDVEGTSSFSIAMADSFKRFIKALGDSLHVRGKELCVELPAVDWSSGWYVYGPAFFSFVGNSADQYFLMAYDYWWSGSTTAGPVAPLQSSLVTDQWHALRSINAFLSKGCPPEKLIAGFPYYGYDWPTTSSATMGTASASANSRTYTVVKNNYIDTIPASRQFWSSTYNTRFYKYVSGGTWRQTWYDDSLSLSMKYDSVKMKHIAGTGMWALGYDGTEKELWNTLRRSFVTAIPERSQSPSEFMLMQNYPNPFNPETTVRFTLAASALTELMVTNMLGQTVAVLFSGYAEQGKMIERRFNGTGLSSGMYFLRLRSGNVSQTRKMVLLR
ncbi:MAG: glycosyl hydrolase family 18 protein [Bacteroidota bacterium]